MRKFKNNIVDDISFPVRIEELAVGILGDDNYFTIPAVQRGLVWNSVRCEVLWDSILRGIPIGAISVRRNSRNQWEILDGQQRANAIALGYSDFNSETDPESIQRILWIDLAPSDTDDDENARKYCFRLTSMSHPWGYASSKNETETTYFPAQKQKEAVAELEGKWKNANKKGARPYPVEMWPSDSQLPVPFDLLHRFVEREWDSAPSFEAFVNACTSKCNGMNWLEKLGKWKNAHGNGKPPKWDEICKAIHAIERYTIIALNCKSVDEQDVGLYFKRMNKQGIVPGNEELNYSLIKSKLPKVKKLDDYTPRRTTPSRLAHVAMRFWLSRKDGWKDIKGVDVQEILCDKEAFEQFVEVHENGFKELMDRLEEKLTGSENGLMPLHVQFIYNAGDGELAVLLLRYCQENAEVDSGLLRAIATMLSWFSSDLPAAVRTFCNSPSPQEGVMRAFANNRLVRLPSPEELDNFLNGCNKILEEANESNVSAWSDVEVRIKESPYVSDALHAIWYGFHKGKGIPLLLYGCRHFIKEWFNDYDPCSPEWGEQNRPWDYDHIAPQSWFHGNQMKQDWRLPLCRMACDSIGNSTPLPFSLNRAKKDAPPGENYPTGQQDKNAENLHLQERAIRGYVCDGKIHRNHQMAVRFVCTTFNRISALYRNWYEGCEIAKLLDYSKITDKRREQIEFACKRLKESSMPDVKCYFLREPYQHEIQNDWDWAQKWISCGSVGTVMVNGRKVKCLLGIAVGQEDDRVVWEWGARRHPSECETNTPQGWWIVNENDQYIYKSSETPSIEACVKDLVEWGQTYSFSRDEETCEHEARRRDIDLKENPT